MGKEQAYNRAWEDLSVVVCVCVCVCRRRTEGEDREKGNRTVKGEGIWAKVGKIPGKAAIVYGTAVDCTFFSGCSCVVCNCGGYKAHTEYSHRH